MRSNRTIAIVAFAAAGLTVAMATASAQPTLDPKACAPGERLTQHEIRPGTKISPGETLSEKLARTDGVLCPPSVDPEMADKPPEGGALRVIPAPGATGGNPNVRPK